MSANTTHADLECPVFDAVDMAHLTLQIIHDLLDEHRVDNQVTLTARQADTGLYAARLMLEKAEEVKRVWEEVQGAQMRGGA